MAMQYQPVIGEWYETPNGESFEVVAYDPDEGSIEIQYLDGAIEELDLENWLELPLSPSEPPEDWSESMDTDYSGLGLELDGPTMNEGYSFLDELDGLT